MPGVTGLAQDRRVVAGYFPSWAIHARDYRVRDVPADKLTHVIYAFAGVSADGNCESVNPLDDELNFAELQDLKQDATGLFALLSVGGPSQSKPLATAASTAAGRVVLAQSCAAFLATAGFDGLDLYWEAPTSSDTANYTELVKALRDALDAQGASDGKRYLLTAAVGGGQEPHANVDVSAIQPFLDWMNVLAYDFFSGASPTTRFAAPLYAASNDPAPVRPPRVATVDDAVQAYLTAGVPAHKIVLGVPFFGIGWAGVPPKNNGLYQAATGPAQGTWANDGVFDFADLNSNYISSSTRFWQADAAAPWLYNAGSRVMISYDDAQSVGLKADYIVAGDLAGAAVWQLSADDALGSLLGAISLRLNPDQDGLPGEVSPLIPEAARTIQRATLGSISLPALTGGGTSDDSGHALAKFRFLRQLALQPGDVETVRRHLESTADSVSTGSLDGSLWDVLGSFERRPQGSSLPSPDAVAELPLAILRSFGAALSVLRREALALPAPSSTGADVLPPAGGIASLAPRVEADGNGGRPLAFLSAIADAANQAFASSCQQTTLDIGYHNLERLEITPAGIVRGELLATIPLAPLEETAVVQKEWSVTSKEFTSIVTDTLENVSETGVTDNTELTQSTTSQAQHSNQFNITGTVSGGILDVVQASATAGFTAQDSTSQSATQSAKQAQTLTQKASSRSKQEHKTTISTSTVTGTSESTTRTLRNSDPLNPIRIDYFSLVREWRVRLYRYGVRMTYDVVIPEPGGSLRQAYAYREWLHSQLGPFCFNVPYDEITTDVWPGETEPHYLVLAQRYATQVPPPPDVAYPPLTKSQPYSSMPAGGEAVLQTMSFDIPNGYWVKQVVRDWVEMKSPTNSNIWFDIVGANSHYEGGDMPQFGRFPANEPPILERADDKSHLFLEHAVGHLDITFWFQWTYASVVQLTVEVEPTPGAWADWRSAVWNALFEAAQSQYYAQQQDTAAKLAELDSKLTTVDTLTLRREESEEIMKMAMEMLVGQWIIPAWAKLTWIELGLNPGPDPPIPDPANPFGPTAPVPPVDPVTIGAAFAGTPGFQTQSALAATELNVEDVFRFINQAIDWENVVTFLYSYIWDAPQAWNFIRNLQHPDADRQAFLRAGAARVVLTVRKGWEQQWATFVDTGKIYATCDDGCCSSPYLSIAQEIAAYDDRNYPGLPPANPESQAVRVEDAVYATCTAVAPYSGNLVSLKVDSSAGFLVGAQVVIDVYTPVVDLNNPPPQNQESRVVQAVPSATEIVVEKLDHPHGHDGPFPVIQPGEKGVVVSEWNEYTPTSGTDIAVTSNLATIA